MQGQDGDVLEGALNACFRDFDFKRILSTWKAEGDGDMERRINLNVHCPWNFDAPKQTQDLAWLSSFGE